MTNSEISNLGLISWDVYNNDIFFVGSPTDYADGYQVLATSPPSGNGFQALLLEKVDPNVDGSQYVFAFRGTEGWPLTSVESLHDLFITDILTMGTGNISSQFMEAIMFVQSMTDAHDLNAGNTTLTGHSLGGALASVITYVYGFESYTYNAFGIENNDLFNAGSTIGEIFQHFVDMVPQNSVDHLAEVADLLSVDPTLLYEFVNSTQAVAGNVTEVTNYVHIGKSDVQEFVSGALSDLVGGLIGDVVPVVNQDGGGFASNFFAHGIEGLNKSIAVYNDLLTIFPQENYTVLTETLVFMPGDDPVRSFLLALGELLGASDLSSLDSTHLSEQVKNYALPGLDLINLGEKGDAELSSLAKGDKAHAYALLHLNSFVVMGLDYSSHPEVNDQNLTNLSEQYWDDRALFLYQLTHPAAPSSTDKHINFTDLESGITAQTLDSYDEFSTITGTSDYIFGTEAGESISSASIGSDDHLYGMAGNDSITGGLGDDYLEGGEGNDILIGSQGEDRLLGGGGSDILQGGDGNDILEGGEGADTYIYKLGDGYDTLIDSDSQGKVTLADANGLVIEVVAGEFSRINADSPMDQQLRHGHPEPGGDLAVDLCRRWRHRLGRRVSKRLFRNQSGG